MSKQDRQPSRIRRVECNKPLILMTDGEKIARKCLNTDGQPITSKRPLPSQHAFTHTYLELFDD